MKHLILGMLCLFGFGGCTTNYDVRLVFLNVSGQEIYVERVEGLSMTPPVGYLGVSSDEGEFSRLKESSANYFDPVRVGEFIHIAWREGENHLKVDLKRDDLKLPAQLKNETIRFVYHGSGEWRITLAK